MWFKTRDTSIREVCTIGILVFQVQPHDTYMSSAEV